MGKLKRETGSSGGGTSGASIRVQKKKKDKKDKEDGKKKEQKEKNENKMIQKMEQTNKEKGGDSFTTEAKEAMRKFTYGIAQLGVHTLRLQYNELRSFMPADSSKTSFEANPTKCRYKDVPCWEKTRVVLKWPPAVQGDFIHANWVTHPLLEYQFICCQGPLEVTVSDFWRCVWQEKVKQIIMLCRCQELGKDKCAQYWPVNSGDSMSHHGLAVKCQKVDNSDRSFIHSKLQLTFKDETRHVHHRQWTSWPDKSVPKTPMAPFRLLQYARKNPKNPTVIHCSAGVGRTGTLVCIELIYKALLQAKVPNVSQLVRDIRSMRSTAVQTEDQYVYCHYAILQLLHIKGVVPSHFIRHFVREYETYLKLLNENGGKNLPLQATTLPNFCAQCIRIMTHMNDANASKDAISPPSDDGKNESRRDNKRSKPSTSKPIDDDEQGSKREKKEQSSAREKRCESSTRERRCEKSKREKRCENSKREKCGESSTREKRCEISKREKRGETSKRERKETNDNNMERKVAILKRLKNKKRDDEKERKSEKEDTVRKKKTFTRKREEKLKKGKNSDRDEKEKEENKEDARKEEDLLPMPEPSPTPISLPLPAPTLPSTEPTPIQTTTPAVLPVSTAVNTTSSTAVLPDGSKDLMMLPMMSGSVPSHVGNDNQVNVPASPSLVHFDAYVFKSPIEDTKMPEENMPTGLLQPLQPLSPPSHSPSSILTTAPMQNHLPQPTSTVVKPQSQLPSQTPSHTPPPSPTSTPIIRRNFLYKPAQTYTIQQAGGKKTIVYHRSTNQPFIKALAANAGQPQPHILVNITGPSGTTPSVTPDESNNTPK